MDLESALVHSCDVYFLPDGPAHGHRQDQIFRARFPGFGSQTGIDLPHEKAGLVPSREWKKAALQEGLGPWRNLQRFNRPGLYPCYAGADDRLRRGHAQWRRSPQAPACGKRSARGSGPRASAGQNLQFVVNAMRKTAASGTARIVGRKDADMGGKTGTAGLSS